MEHNGESTAGQHAPGDRAGQLGWPEHHITIVDDDLGLSGAGADKRSRFARMRSAVALGPVGIIFSLTDTLTGDNDGGYHPALFNDRFRLGLKVTMSEAERLRAGETPDLPAASTATDGSRSHGTPSSRQRRTSLEDERMECANAMTE